MKVTFIILVLLLGIVMTAYGIIMWIDYGYQISGLVYLDNFRNPIHWSVLGIICLIYSGIEILILISKNE